MTARSPGEEFSLESYRDYLALIARLEVDNQFLGKADISGVVQLTLLEAHQAWPKMAGKSELDTKRWLRSILAHNLIDEMRKLTAQARDVRREHSLEASLEESSIRIENWLAANDSSAMSRLSREEQMSQLARALSQIPDDQRIAVELHHLHGMSLADVAKRLDRSRGAVASLIFRGLSSIRKLLEP
jgi:RNA polymerase sigma-70 factor (ECF subfamily)